ncbi:MAG: hypothetical protein ABH868_07250 [bacterium]
MGKTIRLQLYFVGTSLLLTSFYELVQIHAYNFYGDNTLMATVFFVPLRIVEGVFVLFFNFNVVALARKNKFWFKKLHLSDFSLFTLLGVVYTQYNEVLNVYFLNTWGYKRFLPLMPVFRIGITPFVQWAVFAPLIVIIFRDWYSAADA